MYLYAIVYLVQLESVQKGLKIGCKTCATCTQKKIFKMQGEILMISSKMIVMQNIEISEAESDLSVYFSPTGIYH